MNINFFENYIDMLRNVLHRYTDICFLYKSNCNVLSEVKNNICCHIKIELWYEVEFCYVSTQISLHESLVIVSSVTICRGVGILWWPHYRPHSFVIICNVFVSAIYV